MKKFLFFFALITSLGTLAQVNDAIVEKKLYVKANALFLPLGIINAGAEYQLNKKMTIQGDVFISPWKSFDGKLAQIYMLGFDGRYYFEEAFNHFYVGVNISGARFIMQKYNYWGNSSFQFKPESPIYETSDLYQNGFSFFLGATVGYQFKIDDRWNMDFYLSGGTSQAFYNGYHKELGIRYDDDGRRWNKSGELIPYRGGVMIAYKLR